MQELTKAQKARNAIKVFKTTADALALRGYYKPSGKSGQTLSDGLKMISPEIYGTMNDPGIVELKGLEYVIDRLPKGIETCTRITLTAREKLDNTSFEIVFPAKRRRASYRISENEMCFVITRGLSEIYDLLTHLTFLNIEAEKIRNHIKSSSGHITREWKELEKTIEDFDSLDTSGLDQAIWNLSIILGRTFGETRETFEYLEKNRKENDSSRSLFHIIYSLGTRLLKASESRDDELLIYFSPSLKEMIGHHQYAEKWADSVKEKIDSLGYGDRPIHIISSNPHSVMNTLYAWAAAESSGNRGPENNIYAFFEWLAEKDIDVRKFASEAGLTNFSDTSGAFIDFQIIDTEKLLSIPLHPALDLDLTRISDEKPVIIVMDYAFGQQAFEVMDELLEPYKKNKEETFFDIRSISVMGKAGTLPGKKGDIMLANAHVVEGTTHSYIVDNDLVPEDFDNDRKDSDIEVFTGPILTVLGTSLQNRDVLERFQSTSWKVVGLEMEGGHYQRAISAAIIRGHIGKDVRVRYAYYASDNPLLSGQTLASGSMGTEGIRPTYMITKTILKKIFE